MRIPLLTAVVATLPLIISVNSEDTVPTRITSVRSIRVGKEPKRAVMNAKRNEIYVSNYGDGTISIINAVWNSTETISLGARAHPDALAISADGAQLYVGNQATEKGKDGSVVVIDMASRKISRIIKVDVESGLPNQVPVRDMALSPDGGKIYVALEYVGLGKIEINQDYQFSLIDKRSCPEAVVFCRNKGRTLAYVNYQCSPSPGTPGHDPIIVYDGDNDLPLTTISSRLDLDPDPKDPKKRIEIVHKMPNVGSWITASPNGEQLWANGIDACSRQDAYDGDGCLARGNGVQVINVIRTSDDSVINTLNFPSWFLASRGRSEFAGQTFITFFPDKSNRVAVGSGSELVIFDSNNFNKADSVPIPATGSLAFTPDRLYAYAPVPSEDSVRILQISMVAKRPVGALWKWYGSKWAESPFKTATEHFSVGLIVWGLLSFSFAKTFASHPTLRFLLDLEVYLRKGRSRLTRLYLSQLRQNLESSLQKREVRIVPLPLRSTSISVKTTTEWIDQFVHDLSLPHHHRVLSRGRGGMGKTVLLQQLILAGIDGDFVPLHFEAVNYEGEASFEAWTEKVLGPAKVPMSLWAWSALQELIINVVDQATEVPQKYQESFIKLVRSQFSLTAAHTRLVLAGRFDPKQGGLIQDLQQEEWEDVLDPEDLSDKDIQRVGSVYLDESGESQIIRNLPDRIKKNIMDRPTAFVVSHYARARRGSARSILNKPDLFREILDAHLQGQNGSALTTLPEVVKLILQRLVKQNFVRKKDRGLPLREHLIEQVGKICEDPSIGRNFGQQNVPIPADFVKRLLPSGLVYLASDRYLFFHDSFEDWLVEEAEES